jgi:hypothetical protein
MEAYPRVTMVSSAFSGEREWNQEASLFLVSNTMKFGCEGRIAAGGVWRQLKHQDRPIR